MKYPAAELGGIQFSKKLSSPLVEDPAELWRGWGRRFSTFYETIKSTFRNPQSALKRMDTRTNYLRIRRKDIAYFKFIIESYEGMAVVRTKDPYEAVVELLVAPGWEKDVDQVLRGLQKEIPIEFMSSYPRE